jgi:hypothetical protein
MAIPTLPEDFKEFLKLLGSKGVEYLLVGGYAVSIHGYVRATNGLDIWVKISPENALGIDSALREFEFIGSTLSPGLFRVPNNIIRMGVPPIRLEILTAVSGVQFDECYAGRRDGCLRRNTSPGYQPSALEGEQVGRRTCQGSRGSGEFAGVDSEGLQKVDIHIAPRNHDARAPDIER